MLTKDWFDLPKSFKVIADQEKKEYLRSFSSFSTRNVKEGKKIVSCFFSTYTDLGTGSFCSILLSQHIATVNISRRQIIQI